MDKVDSALAADLGVGLECVKGNLINFVFAALILGLTCTRTTSHHTSLRGVITSLLHEGDTIAHQCLLLCCIRMFTLHFAVCLEHCPYCSDDNVSCKASNTYRLTNISLVGMPMVIYSQILMWGQSSCCLLAICVLNSMGSKIPPMFAAMVPLGDYHISLRNVHALFSCLQICTRSLCCSSAQMFLTLIIFRCRCYCCFCCCLPLSQGSKPVQIS